MINPKTDVYSTNVEKPVIKEKPAPVFQKISEETLAYSFLENLPEKTKIWETDPKIVQLAYDKIIVLWNKDQKSRNFLKHLIAAFLPYDPMSRMMNLGGKDIFCAITNLKMTGIREVSEHYGVLSVKNLMLNANRIVTGENPTSESEEKIKEISAEIKSKISDMPESVREVRIAVGSDNSDKMLIVETIMALLHFSQNLILQGNKELNFLLKKSMLNRFQEEKQQPEEEKLTPAEVNKLAGMTVYGIHTIIPEKTMSALEKLKKQMETEEEKQLKQSLK